MILSGICSKGNSIMKFLSHLSDIDYITVSDTISGDLYSIDNKCEIKSLITSGNLFGVVSFHNLSSFDMCLCLYAITEEELQLLSYISNTSICYILSPRYRYITGHLDNSNNFFLKNPSISLKYWSILFLLLRQDFDIIDNSFYIISSPQYGIRFELNCSEQEFRKFLTKVKVLKR